MHGEIVPTMSTAPGGDATISAPKSASITALVGGDIRVRFAALEAEIAGHVAH